MRTSCLSTFHTLQQNTSTNLLHNSSQIPLKVYLILRLNTRRNVLQPGFEMFQRAQSADIKASLCGDIQDIWVLIAATQSSSQQWLLKQQLCIHRITRELPIKVISDYAGMLFAVNNANTWILHFNCLSECLVQPKQQTLSENRYQFVNSCNP